MSPTRVIDNCPSALMLCSSGWTLLSFQKLLRLFTSWRDVTRKRARPAVELHEDFTCVSFRRTERISAGQLIHSSCQLSEEAGKAAWRNQKTRINRLFVSSHHQVGYWTNVLLPDIQSLEVFWGAEPGVVIKVHPHQFNVGAVKRWKRYLFHVSQRNFWKSHHDVAYKLHLLSF